METRKDHKRNAYPFVCKSSRKDRIGSIDYRRLQCVENKRTVYHEVLKNSLPTSYCSCWIRPAWRNFGEASASQFASNVKGGCVFADHYIRSLKGSVLIMSSSFFSVVPSAGHSGISPCYQWQYLPCLQSLGLRCNQAAAPLAVQCLFDIFRLLETKFLVKLTPGISWAEYLAALGEDPFPVNVKSGCSLLGGLAWVGLGPFGASQNILEDETKICSRTHTYIVPTWFWRQMVFIWLCVVIV